MKEFAISHVTNKHSLGERHFLEALTRWNYFPNQKASASELPPSICTRRFTPEIARALLEQVTVSPERRKLGYDIVEYRATRYNNVSRVLGIIHPLAFARIFSVFESNRASLEAAMKDDNSSISVDAHNDGRMLIMNYEDHHSKALNDAEKSFGKSFRAHTDVANCFGSIYTHSIEWAAQGFDVAKSNLAAKGSADHWSTDVDRALQWAKRKETTGLPVGPASSSIAVELILASVDSKLRERFEFVRYVDDYSALCATYEEAQEFIRVLGKELSQFRLTLNLAKTKITPLPQPLQESWVSELTNALPPALLENGERSFMNSSDVFQFLDHAIRLNNITPDGSVIKFAVASIASRVQDQAAASVLQYVINLAWHYPILLPYLEQIDARAGYYDEHQLALKLNEIIKVNVLHRRSDGICWALYYLDRLNASPTEECIDGVLETKDCVAITLLSNFASAERRVVMYAEELFNSTIYVKDQHWLLLYQLYLQSKIANPYDDDATFEVLKRYDVDFLCPAGVDSRAEGYCEVVSNPFAEADQIPPFARWMEGVEYPYTAPAS